MSVSKVYDITIVGGGIVGLATAYKLQKKYPHLTISVLEKEASLAFHQTGRNSGVIHSGLYYRPGSFRASNCVNGRKQLVKFAEEHGISKSSDILFKTHEVDSIHLNRPIKISHLAHVLQIDITLLEELNPMYRNKLIPFLNSEKFPIILPHNKAGVFLINEDSIYHQITSMELIEKTKYPAFTDIEKIRYKVTKGDYLGKIAKKYMCSTSDIMLWNDLKSHKIKVGQTLNIYR